MLGKNVIIEFDLNKFLIDDNEDDGYEEKELKEVIKSLLKIYLHRFY